MKNNYLLMAQLFKMRRMMLGYSKRELARIVGISHTELSRIEHGERPNYNIVTLIKMCEVLHFDFIQLLKTCGYLPCKQEEMDKNLEQYIKEFGDSRNTNSKDKVDYIITMFEIEIQ